MDLNNDINSGPIAWQGRPASRLALSMLPAALLVAGGLSLLQIPAPDVAHEVADMLVQIVRPQRIEPVEPPPVPTPEPANVPETSFESETPPPIAESVVDKPADEVSESPVDWRALLEQVTRDAIENQRTAAVNPVFEQQRAAAAMQFRASDAPEKKHIWDNVEKDYLGRTILVSGDCYRVLDDPSAVYRDIFETFTQYFVFCSGGSSVGRELPWVAEVVARHGYLQRQRDERESVPLD